MRNNFQVPANVWKTRNGSAEQIEPAPDGNLTQKLPSGLSGALRMREHSRHRPPQKIVWSSDAASWQHAPNIISRASKIPCLSGALRMRKQPSNARKRLKDIYLRLRELTMHLTGNFPDPHPFNIKNEVNNATPLSSQLAIGGRLTAIGAALPWNSPIVRLPLSVRISLPSYMLWVHYIMQICFCLFCFAVFFPLSPSFYLFFAFSSLSLSSLSFAFPSFFQITAGSLLFASGFFLFCFCFSLSFFRLFCFAGLPFLSPSFYLFFAFSSLSLSSLFFCFFLPFSKLLQILYPLLPASFSPFPPFFFLLLFILSRFFFSFPSLLSLLLFPSFFLFLSSVYPLWLMSGAGKTFR